MDSLTMDHRSGKVDFSYTLPISSVYQRDYGAIEVIPEASSGRKLHIWGYRNELDSLYRLSVDYFPDSLSNTNNPLFYIKLIQHQKKKHPKFYKVTQDGSPYPTAYVFGHCGSTTKRPYILWQETFLKGDLLKTEFTLNEESLIRPKFFSLQDISQAYYEYHFISHSIDSVSLSLLNLGATEYAPKGEEGYENGLNSVKYDLRLSPAKENILRVHIRFKDLENSQSRRVFLVTSVLSGLITVFIAFIIIFAYKLFRNIAALRISKKEENIIEDSIEDNKE